MSESIKMSGRLLIFDKPSVNGILFPKECEISFPEKCPIIYEFSTRDPNAILGNAYISKDERGLICDVILTNPVLDRSVLHDKFNNELSIGGYYVSVKQHCRYGIRVVDKASLKMVSVTSTPADDELKIVIKE